MISPLQDDISKVELINHMGDDLMVVNAARVSYDKESNWVLKSDDEREFPLLQIQVNNIPDIDFTLSQADKKLIKYLASHGHWTPFSQPQLQFRIKMPIFVAREWYRSVVGFTRNEVSRRYVNTSPELYIPQELRNSPDKGMSKQGSSGVHSFSSTWISLMTQEMNEACKVYDQMIADGVAPEQARIILPMGIYTEFIETGSLAAYSRICNLRSGKDVMKETRVYAQAVSELITPLFPVSWDALTPSIIGRE